LQAWIERSPEGRRAHQELAAEGAKDQAKLDAHAAELRELKAAADRERDPVGAAHHAFAARSRAADDERRTL